METSRRPGGAPRVVSVVSVVAAVAGRGRVPAGAAAGARGRARAGAGARTGAGAGAAAGAVAGRRRGRCPAEGQGTGRQQSSQPLQPWQPRHHCASLAVLADRAKALSPAPPPHTCSPHTPTGSGPSTYSGRGTARGGWKKEEFDQTGGAGLRGPYGGRAGPARGRPAHGARFLPQPGAPAPQALLSRGRFCPAPLSRPRPTGRRWEPAAVRTAVRAPQTFGLTGLPAVILGHAARSEIQRGGGGR